MICLHTKAYTPVSNKQTINVTKSTLNILHSYRTRTSLFQILQNKMELAKAA
jgi:hypothetical protein